MHQKLLDHFESQGGGGLIYISFQNDSHKHSHHAAMLQDPENAAKGETHFALTIVSDGFEGVSPIGRHRLINECLAEEMKTGGVHALAIKAKTGK